MQKLRPRFLAGSRKAVLIKLVSALGFGGMVGFCILGCEIAVAYGPPPSEDETMQFDPQKKHNDGDFYDEFEPLDGMGTDKAVDGSKPSEDASKPSKDGGKPSSERD